MGYLNVSSTRFPAENDPIRNMLLLVLFISALEPGSARAQLVEQDVFTTPSYDLNVRSRSPAALSFPATASVKGTCASFLVRRGMHIS